MAIEKTIIGSVKMFQITGKPGFEGDVAFIPLTAEKIYPPKDQKSAGAKVEYVEFKYRIHIEYSSPSNIDNDTSQAAYFALEVITDSLDELINEQINANVIHHEREN